MTTATGDGRPPATLAGDTPYPVTPAAPAAASCAAGEAFVWFKASHSVGTNACVELARAGDLIALRDSKNPDVAPFLYTHAEIHAFLHGAKRGEFDHLLTDRDGGTTGVRADVRTEG